MASQGQKVQHEVLAGQEQAAGVAGKGWPAGRAVRAPRKALASCLSRALRPGRRAEAPRCRKQLEEDGPTAATDAAGRAGNQGRQPSSLEPAPERRKCSSPRPEHTARPEHPKCPPVSGGQQNMQTRRDLASERREAPTRGSTRTTWKTCLGEGGPDRLGKRPACRPCLTARAEQADLRVAGHTGQLPTACLPEHPAREMWLLPRCTPSTRPHAGFQNLTLKHRTSPTPAF